MTYTLAKLGDHGMTRLAIKLPPMTLRQAESYRDDMHKAGFSNIVVIHLGAS